MGTSTGTGTLGGPTFGGPTGGFTVGSGGSGAIDNMGLGGAGAGGDNSCAGEEHEAELIPLDVYVMLDRSLSMEASTASGVTKWEAITSALKAFVADPESDGIGVGIQYFPTNLPCTSNDECDEGLCYTKACRISRSMSGNLRGLIPCLGDDDCPESGDSCVDLGGCGDESCVSLGDSCDNDIECTAVESGVCASQSVCTLSDYTTPEVPIGILPDSSQALLDSLDAYSPAPNPFGLTPTGPALEGAIAYARSWAEEHPERKAIVVLATDGAPTGGCSPSGRAEIAALASVGARATVPVQTYTVGVFAPEDPENPSEDSIEGPRTIRAIAEAGAGQAFVISDQDDVAAQFVAALNSVRSHGLACEFQVPPSERGKPLDLGKVNVKFTPKAGEDAETIGYVEEASECGDEGGWYYYSDPSSNQPLSIRTCDATCTRLTSSLNG
ncbi:MAG TPA: hypothetical protein VFX21_02725, partial [Acidimicrobiia bacterium]|nr:hypothetical protein [Acidimicrobiia bacterium]